MKSNFLGYTLVSIILVTLYFFWSSSNTKLKNQSEIRDYLPVISSSFRNIYDFKHVLTSASCKMHHKVIMVVTSYIGHVELRSTHRRAYPKRILEDLGIKRIFLLAKASPVDKFVMSQESIVNECNRFDDIIQGDFIEAYRNLTYKHIMGLRWTFSYCPNAKFVFKMDDDIVFNLQSILNYVDKLEIKKADDFLLGYVMSGMKPKRDPINKWFVSYHEFSKSYYPPFVSGWMYITTPETARRLVIDAIETPYFWIDDVFVTGILVSHVGIQLTNIRYKNFYLEYYELLDCCINDMITKNITCEFSVGPNGGNNNLLVKFVNALQDCSAKRCSQRPHDRPLKDTCVSLKNSGPIEKGNPIVNMFKL